MSITTSSNWLVNWAIAYSTPYMVGSGVGYADLGAKIFFVWGGMCIISGIFVWAMVYETAGISLEQIDELYERVEKAWLSRGFQPTWSFQDIQGGEESTGPGLPGIPPSHVHLDQADSFGLATLDAQSASLVSGSELGLEMTRSTESQDTKEFPMANVDLSF